MNTENFFYRANYKELADKVNQERLEFECMGFIPTQISLTHNDYITILDAGDSNDLMYLLCDPPILQWMGLKVIDYFSHKTYLS